MHKTRSATPRAVGVAAVLAAASLTFAGCSATTAQADGATIALSHAFLANPAFVVMNDYIEADAEEAGLTLLQPTNANQDPGKQITDVRNLINSGAGAVLATVVDAAAFAPALDYAEEQGVPVVVLDDRPTSGSAYMVVRADNRAMGEQACIEMGTRLDGAGTVLSLQGSLATTNGRDRTDGFAECMADEFPDIEVIERPTEWQAEKAANEAQTALTDRPDIAGIYLQSDSVMLTSVLQVLSQSGSDAGVGEDGHIVLISIDGGPVALDAIRDGLLDAAISQPIDAYAALGVRYAQEGIDGVEQKVGPTDHDSEIVVDEETGNLMDLLPSPVVTKDNVDDSDLWANSPLATQ